MARHGENIRKRIDGRWEARYQVYNPVKGRKTYRSVYGSTYEETKKKRADAVQAAGKESAPVSEYRSEEGMKPHMHTLFSQAADEWLEKVSDNRRHSTYIKYVNVYRIHLESILGSCPLSDMTDRKFQEKISDHLSREGLSDSIRKSVCCVANQILEFAGRKYSFHIPPLKPAAAKPVKRPVETFEKSEQFRLLVSIYNTMDKFKFATTHVSALSKELWLQRFVNFLKR